MRIGDLRWAAAVVAACLLTGCGGTSPVATQGGGHEGTPATITKNTVRLGGASPAVDAAAVARAVYPGTSAGTRPAAVTLVDSNDWRTALAASVLMSAPLRAPVLFTSGADVPAITLGALRSLGPTGAPGLNGAQVVRVGDAGVPAGYAVRRLVGASPFALATAIEGLLAVIRGDLPHQVLIVAADGSPAYAMPAAALAAESGAPILYVTAGGLPPETQAVLSGLPQPTMYVVGPRSQVNDRVVAQLRRFGIVKRVSGANPVGNAIALARYIDGGFGWGVVDPGHGLVFANEARPLDAAAAAPLANSGDYGPLLVLTDAASIPAAVRRYLLSIQPGYTQDPRFGPVRGVYNRGWLIGDQSAISDASQARVDALLEISPRSAAPTPTSVAP